MTRYLVSVKIDRHIHVPLNPLIIIFLGAGFTSPEKATFLPSGPIEDLLEADEKDGGVFSNEPEEDLKDELDLRWAELNMSVMVDCLRLSVLRFFESG